MKCKRFVKQGKKYKMAVGNIIFGLRFSSESKEEMQKVILIQSKINREVYRMERRKRKIQLLRYIRSKGKATYK